MKRDEDEGDGVWSENAEVALAFISIQTQWRWRPNGMEPSTLAGLDYPAARTGIKLAGFKIKPELWRDILIIEAGVLAAQAKEH